MEAAAEKQSVTVESSVAVWKRQLWSRQLHGQSGRVGGSFRLQAVVVEKARSVVEAGQWR